MKAKGGGSIVKRARSDGSTAWTAIFRDLTGKQVWRAFPRKIDAETYLAEQVVAVRRKVHVSVKPITMAEVLDAWLLERVETRRRLSTMKPSTATSYRSIVAVHLRPSFGAIRSDRLSRDAVQKWVRDRADDIVAGDLSPKTFNNIVNAFSAVLVWARRQGYLAHDPLDGVDRLPRTKLERAFLEPAQIDRLLEAAAVHPPADTVLRLACYSGLRRGELFALRWEDIDWGDGEDGGQVHVRRSVYKGATTGPKTAAGIRRVDVPAFVLADLRLHQVMTGGQPGDCLFRSPTGGVLNPDAWTEQVLKPLLEVAGLPSSFGLHGCRHTYASLLVNQNESLKYISRQLGHASISITADLYGHLFRETSAAAMRRLGADTARRGVAANSLLTGPDEPVK